MDYLISDMINQNQRISGSNRMNNMNFQNYNNNVDESDPSYFRPDYKRGIHKHINPHIQNAQLNHNQLNHNQMMQNQMMQNQSQHDKNDEDDEITKKMEEDRDKHRKANNNDPKTKKLTLKLLKESSKDPIFDIISGPKQLNLFVGSSEQGKSHLIKYLLINLCMMKKFKTGIVFTTTKFTGGYDFIANKNLIISKYDEDILKKYLKKIREANTNGNSCPNFIIFDDMIGSLDVRSPFIQNFVSTFRHYNIGIFISTQYVYRVDPLFREQTNRCFIFKQNTKRSYEALYEAFGLGFEDYKSFKKQLDLITSEPYRCLLYKKEDTDMSKKYMAYKAKSEIPDVIINLMPKKNDDSNHNESKQHTKNQTGHEY
jgi:hypothetical protein